jgi:hypothetical protein
MPTAVNMLIMKIMDKQYLDFVNDTLSEFSRKTKGGCGSRLRRKYYTRNAAGSKTRSMNCYVTNTLLKLLDAVKMLQEEKHKK